jgi:hypothetical protein
MCETRRLSAPVARWLRADLMEVHIPVHGVHGFQPIVNADSNGT